MTTLLEEAEKFRKKTGVMLVAAGILSRMYARQEFVKAGFLITPEQLVVLEVLIESDGLYQRQLSEITMKDRPNISRIVSILEKLGYVTRVRDVKLRKIYKICVTQKAKDEFPKMLHKILDVRKVIVKDIDENDMNTCLKVLRKVQDNLIGKVNMQI